MKLFARRAAIVVILPPVLIFAVLHRFAVEVKAAFGYAWLDICGNVESARRLWRGEQIGRRRSP